MYCFCMTKPLRSLLFALLSFGLVSEAAAQSRAESAPIRLSVAGGFNVSRMTFPLPAVEDFPIDGIELDNNSRIGLVAGGLVDFRVAPGIGVLTGGLVSTRGGTLKIDLSDIPELTPPPGVDIPSGPLEMDLRTIYVDVPAFLAAGVARWGENRLEAIGGAMIGLKTSARAKVTFAGISADEPFDEGLPAFDLGLSAGGRFTCGHIFAAAYYTWGLTDLTEGDSVNPIKHRYLTVIGGWRF
jgi:hypothetical protein